MIKKQVVTIEERYKKKEKDRAGVAGIQSLGESEAEADPVIVVFGPTDVAVSHATAPRLVGPAAATDHADA